MARFEIHGIKLQVPEDSLDPYLRRRLEAENYEWRERGALKAHLRPDDRVLDFGAGAGFVSSLAARVVGPANLVSVEPSPKMQGALRRNLDANGGEGSVLIHGAVVPDSHEGDEAAFAMAPAFWGSSLAGPDHRGGPRVQTVPAVRFSALLAEHEPTFVVMDAEGVEAELCLQPWPDHVRFLVLEIHPKVYPATTVRAIFDALSAEGFAYQPHGSGGVVILFERLTDAEGRVLRRQPPQEPAGVNGA